MTSAAIALTLAIASGEPAAAPTEPQGGQDQMWDVLGHFDTYPRAEPYAVADAIEARGASFRTAGFATPDPPEQVLAFYRAEFKREGLMVFDQPEVAKQFLGLSTYDPKTHLERTIVVLPGNGGATRVMLSISNGDQLMRAARSKPGDQTDGLPIHPSGVPARSDAIDGDRRTTTVSYRARVSEAVTIDWILPRLAAQGWVADSSSDEAVGKTLRFRRGSEALEVVVVGAGKRTDVTYLHMH